MAQKDGKLQDPADAIKGQKEENRVNEEMKTLDISSLDISSFQTISESTAQLSHPFEGYPMKDIVIGTDNKGKPITTKTTYIVALNPTFLVNQDPDAPMVKGKKLKTVHSRMVVDYESGRKNIDVVFDREFTMADGYSLVCAIVPSHSARAQLCFEADIRSGKVKVDKRYILLDGDQKNRLRKAYAIIIKPQLKQERLAADISEAEGDS